MKIDNVIVLDSGDLQAVMSLLSTGHKTDSILAKKIGTNYYLSTSMNFSYARILVPTFVHNSHWVAGYVDIHQHLVQYGDSLWDSRKTHTKERKPEKYWLQAVEILADIAGCRKSGISQYRTDPIDKYPQQQDYHNCGPCALMTLIHIAVKKKVTWDCINADVTRLCILHIVVAEIVGISVFETDFLSLLQIQSGKVQLTRSTSATPEPPSAVFSLPMHSVTEAVRSMNDDASTNHTNNTEYLNILSVAASVSTFGATSPTAGVASSDEIDETRDSHPETSGSPAESNHELNDSDFVTAVCGVEEDCYAVFTSRIKALFLSIKMPLILGHIQYNPKISVDLTKQRNGKTKKTDCKFSLIGTKPIGKKWALTAPAKLKLQQCFELESKVHNHSPVVDKWTARFGANRQWHPDDVRLVKAMANHGISVSQVKETLIAVGNHRVNENGHSVSGSGTYQDLANTINKIKKANGTDTRKLLDPGAGLNYLQSNPKISFYFFLNKNEQLERLIWCSENEIQAFERYGDIVTTDTTQGAVHGMKSWSATGVDCEYRTIPFAHGCLVFEDSQTHEWLWIPFEKLFGSYPQVLMSDEDPALVSALETNPIFNSVVHIYCLYHLLILNFPKNMKGLGGDYSHILHLVWIARNAATAAAFELCWKSVIYAVTGANAKPETTASALAYLDRLYSNRNKWCRAYCGKIFTLGTQTSGRVEKYQDLIKRRGCLSLLGHIQAVESVAVKLENKIDFMSSQSAHRIPTKNQNDVFKAFSSILHVSEKYLSHWYMNSLRSKMITSFFFDAAKMDADQIDNEIAEYEKSGKGGNSDNTSGDNNQNNDNIGNNDVPVVNDVIDLELTEINSTQSRLISLQSLSSSLAGSIKNIYYIQSKVRASTRHYLVLLENGSHICTCLLHVYSRVLCEHFFAVQMYERGHALFSLDLVPRRLWKEELQCTNVEAAWVGISRSGSLDWVPETPETSDILMASISKALNCCSSFPVPQTEHHISPRKKAHANYTAHSQRFYDVLVKANAGHPDKVEQIASEIFQQAILEHLPLNDKKATWIGEEVPPITFLTSSKVSNSQSVFNNTSFRLQQTDDLFKVSRESDSLFPSILSTIEDYMHAATQSSPCGSEHNGAKETLEATVNDVAATNTLEPSSSNSKSCVSPDAASASPEEATTEEVGPPTVMDSPAVQRTPAATADVDDLEKEEQAIAITSALVDAMMKQRAVVHIDEREGMAAAFKTVLLSVYTSAVDFGTELSLVAAAQGTYAQSLCFFAVQVATPEKLGLSGMATLKIAKSRQIPMMSLPAICTAY
ncbi:hypothetical protein BDR26DRAFT_934586 [Obelidium mucronatum]|nr:hypothetical protein BDR26DRAFT_934586 [Obelidium mucronatum]